MKLENQVVNLELSLRIEELGFDKESAWWWNGTKWGIGGQIVGLEPMKWILSKRIKGSAIENIPAYTVTELGEMLPIGIVMTKYEFNKGGEIRWACAYNDENIGNRICDDTLANCLARMLIWLRGKKII